MAEVLTCQRGGGFIPVAKTNVAREAREAYAAGLTPNDACPYPFQSECGLHWLAIYNLCIPLSHAQPQTTQP